MSDRFLALALAFLLLLPAILTTIANVAFRCGWWSLSRRLGRLTAALVGRKRGRHVAFHFEAFGLREEGRIAEAATLAKERLLEPNIHPTGRNCAIDILISAGAYEAARGADLPCTERGSLADRVTGATLGRLLIQINLAEADYNVGRWEAAQVRLGSLDEACSAYPITRAGLLQQRAWIAAHTDRAEEALELCARITPAWLPPIYRAEYHFTRAVALLAASRTVDAESALTDGERVIKRLSSRRNALFLRARVAAARGDWVKVEALCREGVHHAFRGQGGPGILLWSKALSELGRHAEADQALRLVNRRDPESESSRTAMELLATRQGRDPRPVPERVAGE